MNSNQILRIEQSCNGLLLCCGPYPSSHTGTRYIYNPSTRHYRTIPPPPQYQKELSWEDWFEFQFYLAFSPQKSPNYEIACVWSTDHKTHMYKIAIYSSETCSWRLVYHIFRIPSYRGFYWNGCLNWIKSGIHTLVYFDIAQQVLKSSPFSDEMDKYSSTVEYYGECMGHLYLILRDKASTSNCFNVFEMEIDYSGWKPISRVDLGELANQYGSGVSISYLYYRILKVFVEGEGDEDELKALILLPYEIISYNLKKESFNKICDYPVDRYVHYSQHDYIGSFANV
ncbi:F-box protein At5g07610-like [Papaver somniferum]|uniref:F-box protein At5g07610-like n=1 Tax=Papaver somniferum TaxID=3469 RepID=UPI000E6F5FB1|nr:F-box protein At5g07610-like [Papaver somniferum]